MRISTSDKNMIKLLKEKAEAGDVYAMDRYATFYSQDHPELMANELIPVVINYFEKAVELSMRFKKNMPNISQLTESSKQLSLAEKTERSSLSLKNFNISVPHSIYSSPAIRSIVVAHINAIPKK